MIVAYYPRPAPFFVRIKAPSISTVSDEVRLYILICVIATLGSDAFQCRGFFQINLNPLLSVSYLGDPTSSCGAIVSRLQPGIVWSIVPVVHGRCAKAGFCNAAILHSERYEATICKGRNTLKLWFIPMLVNIFMEMVHEQTLASPFYFAGFCFNRFNQFNLISLAILLTICHKILLMLVQRNRYWID